MAGVSSWTPGSWLLCLLYFCASRASCGSIASWWTDPLGATILVQDDETALIRYSLCNSDGTPVLPEDRSLTLPLLKYPPKNGTGLAGVGWTNGPVTTASIFYQDQNDEITNTLLSCDNETGHWTNSGDYQISLGATSPSPNTTLAAVVLGEYAGYRVFYTDTSNRLRCLGYVQNGPWGDWGVVSNDEIGATAIGAAFTGEDNMTVVTPKGQGNMEVTQLYDDGLWHTQTLPRPLSDANVTNATKAGSYAFDAKARLPFTLPAWEGTARALGVSINEKDARSVFYLGTDGELYQVTDDDDDDADAAGGGGWKVAPRPGADAWPKADAPAGPLGVASHYGRRQVRVHYMSGGRMVEARGEGGVWSAATALPNYNSSAQNPDARGASASATTSATASATADAGLTTGAKIGVGVGVALGALALAGMLGALLFLRRRQRQRRHEASTAVKSPAQSHYTSPPQSQYPSPASYPAYPPPPPPPQGPFPSYAPGGSMAATEPSYHHRQPPPPPQPPAWGYSPLGPEKRADPKRPGELDGPQLYEMSEQRGRHELMGEGHIQEAP